MDKALIFDIQGFSVHDGPGARTLIFRRMPPALRMVLQPRRARAQAEGDVRIQRCKRSKYACSAASMPAWCMKPTGWGGAPVAFDHDTHESRVRHVRMRGQLLRQAVKLSGTWMGQDEVRT